MIDDHIDKKLVQNRKVSSSEFNDRLKYLNKKCKDSLIKPVPPRPIVKSDTPNLGKFMVFMIALSLGVILCVFIHNLVQLVSG